MLNKTINQLRFVAAETISHAKSGHTGVALGAAPIFYALFANHLFLDPKNPTNPLRDRFVLSAGHASALYYATLNLFNLGISNQDLLDFRKVGSKTPGHPETETAFVDASTGPLGQGIAMGVGMAIAEEFTRANTLQTPLNTYVFHGDGCLMEGVALEAISLAGNLKLERLILLYDYNQITIDGKLDISNKENVKNKFKSQGWRVVECKDGNNTLSVSKAIAKAKKPCGKPTIVICPTIIGFGSIKQGSHKIHGVPLVEEELLLLKQALKIDYNQFGFSSDVLEFANQQFSKRLHACAQFKQISESKSEWVGKEFESKLTNALKAENVAMSGRDASATILNKLALSFNTLIGGTADLVPSVKAYIANGGDFCAENRSGKNIRYGVREHAMAAIANGIALFNQNKTFVSTFFSFSNYMLPAMRLSSFMKLPVIYLFTHDSVFAGEDGPTHQPVEQLGSLRLIPHLNVVRPCDVNETLFAWQLALTSNAPTCIVLAKQTLPAQNSSIEKAQKGGYLIKEEIAPVGTIIANGSEVELAMLVAEILKKENILMNVASMPCTQLLESQNAKYIESVLGVKALPKFVIEASNDNIWYKYIAGNGLFFGVQEYGKSGKGEDVYALYFEAKAIAKKIAKFLSQT